MLKILWKKNGEEDGIRDKRGDEEIRIRTRTKKIRSRKQKKEVKEGVKKTASAKRWLE